jgi:hypothetical protein
MWELLRYGKYLEGHAVIYRGTKAEVEAAYNRLAYREPRRAAILSMRQVGR